MKAIISLFILLLICSACKDEVVAKDSSYSEEFRYYKLVNVGWKSKVEKQKVDSITFKATQVPIQYYIFKQKGRADLKEVDSIYELHKRERIIEFLFEDDNEEDLLQSKFTDLDYQQSVSYLSSDIAKDFYVVTSSHDTIPCSGVLYERSFKVAPYTKVLLFFTDIDPKENIQLVYRDVLYRKGNIKLRFTDSTPDSTINL